MGDFRARRAIRIAALALAAAMAGEAGAEMYRWTDSEGNVHYSDKPPPGQEAERVRPEGSVVETPSAAGDTNGQSPSGQAGQAEDNGEDAPQEGGAESGEQKQLSKKECDKVRERLEIMETRPGSVLLRKDDGSVDRLTEEERQQRMERNRNLLEKRCQ